MNGTVHVHDFDVNEVGMAISEMAGLDKFEPGSKYIFDDGTRVDMIYKSLQITFKGEIGLMRAAAILERIRGC